MVINWLVNSPFLQSRKKEDLSLRAKGSSNGDRIKERGKRQNMWNIQGIPSTAEVLFQVLASQLLPLLLRK